MKNKPLRIAFWLLSLFMLVLTLATLFFPGWFVENHLFWQTIFLQAFSAITYIFVCRAHFRANFGDC